jgi:hypothetical protein
LCVTGVDPGLAAAEVACGRRPAVEPDRRLVGAVRFFYTDSDDTMIAAIDFDRTGLPAEVDRTVPLIQPGEVVSPPPKGSTFGRIALATAVGGTAHRCRAALDAAQAALQVSTVPRALTGLS